MEFRKIYIRRLLPVLGIILVLVLTIIGHTALKAQAQVADAKDKINQISSDNSKEKIDTSKLKNELSKEVQKAVEDIFLERMEEISLSDYFSEEDYNLLYETLESRLILSEEFYNDGEGLSDEQKAIVNSLISEAISLYAKNNIRTSLTDEMKKEVTLLIDDAINPYVEDMIEKKISKIKAEASLSDDEKAKLVAEISNSVQHDLLAYITEHIQLLYEGEEGPQNPERTLICDKEEHAHSLDCYEGELVCEDESEEHIHTEDCYEYTLVCEKEEHLHGDSCYEEKSSGSGNGPCVHVHVDYLLTDDDRKKIVEDIISGTDLSKVLSEIFYEEIQKTMTEIIKEKMYEAVLDNISKQLEEKINKAVGNVIERVDDLEKEVEILQDDLTDVQSRVAILEANKPTVRYNEITGRIECLVNGEWKDFMSASSLWASNGIIYSAGKKSEAFTGMTEVVNATQLIQYSETESALQWTSKGTYIQNSHGENIYSSDPNAPFEYSIQYNTLSINYGVKTNRTGNSSDYYMRKPTLTVQVVDYYTNEVVSQNSASTSSGFHQGTMELQLPDGNPYIIKVVFSYADLGTVKGSTSSCAGYIYSMQCVKK